MYVWVCVLHDKTKTPDRRNLKLGTVVVLDSLSKPIGFGFNRSGLGLRPAGQKLCLNAAGVTECNSK